MCHADVFGEKTIFFTQPAHYKMSDRHGWQLAGEDISLRCWWRLKIELKENKYWISETQR